jgi:hypothetical protein
MFIRSKDRSRHTNQTFVILRYLYEFLTMPFIHYPPIDIPYNGENVTIIDLP